MPASSLQPLASLLSIVLILFASAIAQAQQPTLEMHRTGVNADDGTGWHPAVSTKGSFSIHVPIPFNDFTARDASTGEASHAIGGKSSEGIKYVATELPIIAKTPNDLAAIPKTFSSNPANKVSDVSRQTKDNVDTLSFSVTSPASGAHFRYIRTKSALYMLTIEFPNEHREVATATKDRFFGSFKLKVKS